MKNIYSSYIDIKDKYFSKYEFNNRSFDKDKYEFKMIKLATTDQVYHLNQCIKAGKYVEPTIAPNTIKNRLKQIKF